MRKHSVDTGVVALAALLAMSAAGVVHGLARDQTPPAAGQQTPGSGGQGRRPTVGLPRDAAGREPTPAGTATIAGLVRAGDTGRPLARARVLVTSAESREQRATQTNDAGRYEIRELPAGRYTVTVSKPGFVTLSLGQRRPRQPSLPLTVRDDEQFRNVDLVLPRGGVISGQVVDEQGAPLVRAVVQVQRYEYRQGVKRLVPEGMDTTDDRGQYRVFDLEPGEYYVTASAPRDMGRRFFGGGAPGVPMPGAGPRGGGGPPPDDRDDEAAQAYAPTYYPGATSAAAAGRLSLGLGQEMLNVDFPMLLVPTARIDGTVVASGRRLAGGNVFLLDRTNGFQLPYRSRFGDDGVFRLTGVPPGDYSAIVQARVDGVEGSMSSASPLGVSGGDQRGVTLLLLAGGMVSGRVVFDGLSTMRESDVTRLGISLESGDPSLSFGGRGNGALLEADRTFAIQNVSPGLARVRVTRLPADWVLESAVLHGVDVADVPFEIKGTEKIDGLVVTLTDRRSSITGAVRTERGEVVADYTVVVFPADEALWSPQSRRIAARRPDQQGQFEILGLPAGRYLMAAVDVIEEGEWNDPAFLQRLRPRAIAFELTQGAQLVQDLKIVTDVVP